MCGELCARFRFQFLFAETRYRGQLLFVTAGDVAEELLNLRAGVAEERGLGQAAATGAFT